MINTATTGRISYAYNTDPIVEAPFDLNGGAAYYNMNLALPDVISPGDSIIIDFTRLSGYDLGTYLTAGSSVVYAPEENVFENVSANYIWVKFNDANAFDEVYAESPVTIIGLFKDGRTAEGYVVNYACDAEDTTRPTTQGGIVFFNESVADKVRALTLVPEPATATLSLLALAGLAMRRRRCA